MACEAFSCYACNNKPSKQINDIAFYRFPDDSILRKAWILAVRRKDFVPDNFSVLCSEHFKKSDFEEGPNFQTVLKEHAVPSIFKTHSIKPILSKKSESGGGNRCSVASCYSNSRKAKQEGLPLKFFTFPHDPVLRKEWVRRCQRADKFDPTHRRICSLHFTKDDYEDGLQAELLNIEAVKLKKKAVPSRNLPSTLKLGNSSPPVQPSPREQRYSEKLRKQVVEECLNEYNEKASNVNSNKELTTPSNKSGSISKKMKTLLGEDSPEEQEKGKKECFKRKRRSDPPKKRENIYENLKKHVAENRLGQHTENEEVSPGTNGKIVFIPNSGCWVMNDCLKCPILRKEIESLKKVIAVHKQKERDLEVKLSALYDQLTNPDAVFEEKAKEAFKDFLSSNQVNVALKKKTKTWWTQEDMSKAFSILYFSKPCYLHLRNTLHYPLPGLSTLRKWTSDMEKLESTTVEKLASTTVEESVDTDKLTSEINSPEVNLSFEDQQVENASLELGFSSDKPMDPLFEEENSNGSLNLEGQQINNMLFTQSKSSDHPDESESEPVDDDNSNGSLNLDNEQIKMFCLKENFPSGHINLKNTAPGASYATSSKPIDKPTVTNKKFQFQSYLQNYLKNRKQFRSQISVPAKQKPFTCSVCQQGFDKNGSLKNHFKMHLPIEDQFKCDVCDEDFASKFYLEKHILTHKTDEKFVCDICDKSFLKKSTYKDHYVLHKNLKAQKLEKEEPIKEQCIVVYAAPVADESPSNSKYLLTRYSVPKSVKPYLCHICDELFDDKSSLKSHLPVHGENGRKVYEKQYTCEFCNKEFKYHHYFREHLLKCAEKVIFECRVCDEPFSSGDSLKKHMAVHETKTFFCEICNNGFKQKCDLTLHMREHLDEKLFQCYWCFKRFAHKDVLKEHVKAHKNEKS